MSAVWSLRSVVRKECSAEHSLDDQCAETTSVIHVVGPRALTPPPPLSSPPPCLSRGNRHLAHEQ